MGEAAPDAAPTPPWTGVAGKPSWPWNRLGHGAGGRKLLAVNEEEETTLTFREQADGRKVSRLPGGKVVLVHVDYLGLVKGGERWKVRLQHRAVVAIAFPLERVAIESAPGLGIASSHQSLADVAVVRQDARPRAGTPRTEVILPSAKPALAPTAPQAAPAAAPVAPQPLDGAVNATLVTSPPPSPLAVIKETDSVAFFVDGANTDGACRQAGFWVDFAKAKRYFLGKGRFYAGFYFVADFTNQDPLQQRFMDFLSHNGYVVRKKAVKTIKDDETGEVTYKSNVDVDLAVELLNTDKNYDVAYLFSGDSDYERVVDILRSRGKRVYVVSARQSLSRELAYVADKPIFYLEEHRKEIERDERQATA